MSWGEILPERNSASVDTTRKHCARPLPSELLMMMLQWKLEPRHLVWLLVSLIAVELVLVSIYAKMALATSPSQIGVLFNLDEEANVPSWFSSTQLFAIGVVILLATLSPLRDRDRLHGLLAVLG